MNWINELPLEHTSSNGTTFKAARSDLEGPVTVSFPSWSLTEEQKREDFLQFGTWHRGCIFSQLNGFSGYDRIAFVYGTDTGRMSCLETGTSAQPKSGALAESDAPSTSGEPGLAEQIIELIAEHLNWAPAAVVPSATVCDLGLDSLAQVELVMAVEDEFDLEITDDELERVSTVQDFIDLVTTRKGQ